MATCIQVVRREFTESNPWDAMGLVASTVEVSGVYNVTGIGAVVARSTNATVTTAAYANVGYRLTGQYQCTVDTGITIAKGDKIWYNSSTDRVTNTQPTSGFVFGKAVTVSSSYGDGNSTVGVAAGTVVCDVLQLSGSASYIAGGATAKQIIVASGTANLTGTSATETITTTGTLSTDSVFAILNTIGSNASVAINGARMTADTTLTLYVGSAAGTGSGAIAQYFVTRTAS